MGIEVSIFGFSAKMEGIASAKFVHCRPFQRFYLHVSFSTSFILLLLLLLFYKVS